MNVDLVGTGDIVATWEVHLPDGIHVIEFEHGTTSGKRIIRVDSEEILRKDWMFKLVGNETFKLGKDKANCVVKIEPLGGFSYQYSLEVNGKPYKTFVEQQSKAMKTWVLPVDGEMCRVVMERDSLDIWVNGQKVETAGEFTDEGTETHFNIKNTPAYIRQSSKTHFNYDTKWILKLTQSRTIGFPQKDTVNQNSNMTNISQIIIDLAQTC